MVVVQLRIQSLPVEKQEATLGMSRTRSGLVQLGEGKHVSSLPIRSSSNPEECCNVPEKEELSRGGGM